MEIPAPPSDHIPLGGVVSLEGRSRTPNDPVLRGQRAGPLAAGVLIYAPLGGIPAAMVSWRGLASLQVAQFEFC